MSGPGDTPACWAWPASQCKDIFDLAEWHDGRCGVCNSYEGVSLVLDHDHATNLVRGFLCYGCNLREGHAVSRERYPVYVRWSRRPSATLVNLEVPYVCTLSVPALKRWSDGRELPVVGRQVCPGCGDRSPYLPKTAGDVVFACRGCGLQLAWLLVAARDATAVSAERSVSPATDHTRFRGTKMFSMSGVRRW